MCCVYILISESHRDKFYIGYTENLNKRLKQHQDPASDAYTRRYRPWKLETYITFDNKRLAKRFEVYLKSHSGRAFLRRRLMSPAKPTLAIMSKGRSRAHTRTT